jgi:hypothetical protein
MFRTLTSISAFMILFLTNLVQAEVVHFSGRFSFTLYDLEYQNSDQLPSHSIETIRVDLGSSEREYWESKTVEQGFYSGVLLKIMKDPNTKAYSLILKCTRPNKNPIPDFLSHDYGEVYTAADTQNSFSPIELRCGRTDFKKNNHRYGLEASFELLPVSTL